MKRIDALRALAATGASAAFGAGVGDIARAADQAVQGVTPAEVVVGAFTPVSGNFTVYHQFTEGAQAYFDMVNAQGGVGGRKIRYVTRDDGFDPSRTVTVAKQLVEEDQVFALVGAVGTPSNASVIPYMQRIGIPNVSPIGGSDIYFKDGFIPNYFPVTPRYELQAKMLAGYAIGKLKAAKVAIAYVDDSAGQPGNAGVTEALKAHNMQPAQVVSFPPSEVDFASYAEKLKASKADAVFVWTGPAVVTQVQKAADAIGYKPLWFGPYLNATPTYFKLGGAEGAYFDSWLVPLTQSGDPSVVAFLDALKKYAPNTTPGTLSETGWVSAAVFVQGLKLVAAGKKPLTWASFMDAMNTMHNWDAGLAKGITYTPTSHLGVTQESVLQVKDGKFVQVSPPIPL